MSPPIFMSTSASPPRFNAALRIPRVPVQAFLAANAGGALFTTRVIALRSGCARTARSDTSNL
jgi:hypothetical protein